ncbi:MarR family winged helix-turn-helix transcriptional regulator [Nocardia sp. NPDC052566]|uniref:MarR family winged helix-turn-helix transcriptional regulator n=1 Tax=Nocardia sp. NPDC052566 TaxID=3364330 RepID=UPI0037C5662F
MEDDAMSSLEPVEQRAWEVLIQLTTRLPAVIDSRLLRDFGLTHFQYRLLVLLDRQCDGELRMVELTHRMGASISRVSHVVSRLEDQGLARRIGANGKPGVHVRLTELGRRMVADVMPWYQDTARSLILDHLNREETSQLATLGELLTTRLAGSRWSTELGA